MSAWSHSSLSFYTPPPPSPTNPPFLQPDIPTQLLTAPTLSHLLFLLPTSSIIHDILTTAWFIPTTLSAHPPPRPELADDEDESNMLSSLTYLESLLTTLTTTHSIPPHRIAIVGFSQGCAMALLVNLLSKEFAGRLAGVIGLMGYLPLGAERLRELREERGLEDRETGKVVAVRGGRDRLVPRRIWEESLKGLGELGVKEGEGLEVQVLEETGHIIDMRVLNALWEVLGRWVPEGKLG